MSASDTSSEDHDGVIAFPLLDQRSGLAKPMIIAKALPLSRTEGEEESFP